MTLVYVVGGLFTVIALVGHHFESYIAKDMERRRMKSDDERRQSTLDRYITGAQNNWAEGFKEVEEEVAH
jgi:hypothetical protein